MNSLVRDHLPATYFAEYQSLRESLVELLTDDDLRTGLGGDTATLGALCREIGEIEHSYVESLRTFRQDFAYRHPDPAVETSVVALAAWYRSLDSALAQAIASIPEEDVATRHILRSDFEIDGFAPLAAVQLDIYREALLIFYGKASVYMRALGRPLPARWREWIG